MREAVIVRCGKCNQIQIKRRKCVYCDTPLSQGMAHTLETFTGTPEEIRKRIQSLKMRKNGSAPFSPVSLNRSDDSS